MLNKQNRNNSNIQSILSTRHKNYTKVAENRQMFSRLLQIAYKRLNSINQMFFNKQSISQIQIIEERKLVCFSILLELSELLNKQCQQKGQLLKFIIQNLIETINQHCLHVQKHFSNLIEQIIHSYKSNQPGLGNKIKQLEQELQFMKNQKENKWRTMLMIVKDNRILRRQKGKLLRGIKIQASKVKGLNQELIAITKENQKIKLLMGGEKEQQFHQYLRNSIAIAKLDKLIQKYPSKIKKIFENQLEYLQMNELQTLQSKVNFIIKSVNEVGQIYDEDFDLAQTIRDQKMYFNVFTQTFIDTCELAVGPNKPYDQKPKKMVSVGINTIPPLKKRKKLGIVNHQGIKIFPEIRNIESFQQKQMIKQHKIKMTQIVNRKTQMYTSSKSKTSMKNKAQFYDEQSTNIIPLKRTFELSVDSLAYSQIIFPYKSQQNKQNSCHKCRQRVLMKSQYYKSKQRQSVYSKCSQTKKINSICNLQITNVFNLQIHNDMQKYSKLDENKRQQRQHYQFQQYLRHTVVEHQKIKQIPIRKDRQKQKIQISDLKNKSHTKLSKNYRMSQLRNSYQQSTSKNKIRMSERMLTSIKKQDYTDKQSKMEKANFTVRQRYQNKKNKKKTQMFKMRSKKTFPDAEKELSMVMNIYENIHHQQQMENKHIGIGRITKAIIKSLFSRRKQLLSGTYCFHVFLNAFFTQTYGNNGKEMQKEYIIKLNDFFQKKSSSSLLLKCFEFLMNENFTRQFLEDMFKFYLIIMDRVDLCQLSSVPLSKAKTALQYAFSIYFNKQVYLQIYEQLMFSQESTINVNQKFLLLAYSIKQLAIDSQLMKFLLRVLPATKKQLQFKEIKQLAFLAKDNDSNYRVHLARLHNFAKNSMPIHRLCLYALYYNWKNMLNYVEHILDKYFNYLGSFDLELSCQKIERDQQQIHKSSKNKKNSWIRQLCIMSIENYENFGIRMPQTLFQCNELYQLEGCLQANIPLSGYLQLLQRCYISNKVRNQLLEFQL